MKNNVGQVRRNVKILITGGKDENTSISFFVIGLGLLFAMSTVYAEMAKNGSAEIREGNAQRFKDWKWEKDAPK
jgi:hypothetical protein